MFTVCAKQQLNVSAGYIPTHHRVSLEAPQILLPEIELIPSHFICRDVIAAGTKFRERERTHLAGNAPKTNSQLDNTAA